MQSTHETLPTSGAAQFCCFDKQYRPTFHGLGQRYVSPTTGRCRPLTVQAVHPKFGITDRVEVPVGGNVPKVRKLAIWLVTHPPSNLENIPEWLMRWAWFTLALIWPFTPPRHSGVYPPYLSRYQGQLWAARSPREYALRKEQPGVQLTTEIARLTHPRRLVIYDSVAMSWQICEDPDIIKQQRYIAISYRYEDIVPKPVDDLGRAELEEVFIAKVQATVAFLHKTAYWIDLTLIEKKENLQVNEDVYRMADVYRSAEFTLIMLNPAAGVTEKEAWLKYGERLWTFPEALLSKELHFKFRDSDVTCITLHQLANLAYTHLPEESAVVNAYGLRDPLERLERLSMLKSALWRRTSGSLERVDGFKAERVYALMGFFEHRIYPDFQETELQALARLSMANDSDRIVERMVSLLPSEISDTACWYAEEDRWGSNLWDIDPEIQVVGMTQNHAIVLGGCRAAAIRWKDFPSIAFATQRSFKRLLADYLPNLAWYLVFIGIILVAQPFPIPGAVAPIIIGLLFMLVAPFSKAYATSGRIVHAQPWLIGVKGLVSAEDAATLLYGGSIGALPRTFYSPSGTPLARTEKGQFRRGDPVQLEDLKSANSQDARADDLYTLIDTISATIYYFHADRPPTVCLFTGRESGMGRFVLCSERCTINELHKETVIRMPWYLSQHMRACDWVALG